MPASDLADRLRRRRLGASVVTEEAIFALLFAIWLAWGAVIFWTGDMK